MDSQSDAGAGGITDEWNANGDADVNGDDDMAATMGGTDEGGGMYATPDPLPRPDDDDDDGNRKPVRGKRRHPRPMFRSTRQARRTPR